MLKTSLFLGCMGVLSGYKAVDVVVVNAKRLASKIIICSCDSSRHVKALAFGLMKFLKKSNIEHSVEGIQEGNWILLDIEELIIHIFRSDVREYYDIDSFYIMEERKNEQQQHIIT